MFLKTPVIQWKSNKKGISIIEILVIIGIINIALTTLLGVVSFSFGASTLIKETTQAVNLAQESIEATRSIRDSDWNKIINGNHGITNISGYWGFDNTENIINGFTRTILIEDVQRDVGDNIVEGGGISDPNTKKATATVSWIHRGEEKSIEIITYFTNWRK